MVIATIAVNSRANKLTVPRWLMDELLGRLKRQLDLPPARVKTCRGRLFSQIDYATAVKEWGFVDVDEGAD
jgi:hypothetical protein